MIDSTVQRSVTDPCNPASTHFSPDLQGLESLVKKKKNKHQPANQKKKEKNHQPNPKV